MDFLAKENTKLKVSFSGLIGGEGKGEREGGDKRGERGKNPPRMHSFF